MTDTTQLRNQLATRRNQEPAQPSNGNPLAAVVRQAVQRQAKGFQAVLPANVDPERFARLVVTAVKANPGLLECFETDQGQTSVLLAAMQAATIGLEPNTPTHDCWLLPRKVKVKDVRGRPTGERRTECELSIGYRGYQKLATRGGALRQPPFAVVVHEKDHFRYQRGIDNDIFEHEASSDADPGPITHVVAIARFKDGGSASICLNRREVEKRRAVSESWKNERSRPYSPWTLWEPEMYAKTGIRALCTHQLELSTDVARAIETDESRLALNDDDGVIEAAGSPFELDEAPELPDTSGDEEVPPAGVDVQTGEIVGDETPVTVDVGPVTVHDDAEPQTDAETVEPDPDVANGPMTQAQARKLHASMRDAGILGPQRYSWAGARIKRPITSFNDVTRAEASVLIDELGQRLESKQVESEHGEG